MIKHFISIALVQKSTEGHTRFLLRRRNAMLEFIVGCRLERENFRETVIREVAWQLNLDRRRDMLVSNMSQLSIEFEEPTVDSFRHVALAFYNVHLSKKKVIESVDRDQASQWVTAAEICGGQTSGGQLIHPEVVGWINKYEVVRPWQV